MRSFLLASLALVSAALASQEAPLGDNALLGRSFPLLNKNVENSALKVRRDPLYQQGLALIERQITDTHRAQGLTKRDVEKRSLIKRQLEAQRCGLGPSARSQICRDYVTNNVDSIPRDSYANCNQNTGFCRLKCRNGFTLSRGVCVQNIGNCAPEVVATCGPRPRNGVWTCPNGVPCQLVCLYGRTPINGQCVDTKFDPAFCGGGGCPAPYNGIGEAACFNYQCTIRCPANYRIGRTSTGEKYCVPA